MITIQPSPSHGFLPLNANESPLPIVCSSDEPELVGIAAQDLVTDLQAATGQVSERHPHPPTDADWIILVGSLREQGPIRDLVQRGLLPADHLDDTWEQWVTAVVDAPFPGVKHALVIAGSDRRGAAYGVYELTRILGVSPWSWWADAPIRRRPDTWLGIENGRHLSRPPRVRYRAFYINDEIFGLLPWATGTLEQTGKGLDHHTYEKVFQLMVRLRANYLWPALKKGSRPFSHDPLNRVTADRYGIVVGGSHAEPLTMCTWEWDWSGETRGDWNYKTNRDQVLQFLEERVEANKIYENVYTLGMRGRDDVSMEGAEDIMDAATILENVIRDQREILRSQLDRPLEEIPQTLTVYKEVLKQYDMGLQVPDDVTLIWTDDNFGYFKRLPGTKEKRRSGGNGAYYHLSYLGRPHDYLWLESIPPALIVNELRKAADCGADRIWIINVGDVKPLEYNLQLCFDLAWNPDAVTPDTLEAHQQAFYAENVDSGRSGDLARLRAATFALNRNRKPEHAAWSRIEQWRAPFESRFSWIHEQEAGNRLRLCTELEQQAHDLLEQLPEASRDAGFQLAVYPALASALTHRKWLLASKAEWFHRQGRAEADTVRQQAYDCWKSIWDVLHHLQNLRDSKWRQYIGMFPMEVNKSPLFRDTTGPEWIEPEEFNALPFPKHHWGSAPGLWVEGQDGLSGSGHPPYQLPVLTPHVHTQSFFELFTRTDAAVDWSVSCDHPALHFSRRSGSFSGTCRVDITLNPHPFAEPENRITFTVQAGDQVFELTQPVHSPALPADTAGAYVESRGMISIPAYRYSSKTEQKPYGWQTLHGLGIHDRVIKAVPETAIPLDHEWDVEEKNPYLEYRFFTVNRGWVQVGVYTLPTHSVSKEHGAAYAVAMNPAEHDGPTLVHDQSLSIRDERFLERVEQGFAFIQSKHVIRTPGWQTLRLYLCDPGILFDHIVIHFAPLPDTYLPPAPTLAATLQ